MKIPGYWDDYDAVIVRDGAPVGLKWNPLRREYFNEVRGLVIPAARMAEEETWQGQPAVTR